MHFSAFHCVLVDVNLTYTHKVITSSYTPCLVSTDPTLTPDNLTRVLETMGDGEWDVFADCINLPDSEQDKIRSQHASDRDCKLALPHVFISAHPTPSWELVAHALYQMGTLDDSSHRPLEYLQQHFPTGTVCIQSVYMYIQLTAVYMESRGPVNVHEQSRI